MKTDFVDETTIVVDSKINSVESTSWESKSGRIFANYYLVLLAGNLTSLKDDNLNKLPIIEY